MPASFLPSIGEILSIFAPPPRHSPSKTPALSSVRPSFSNTDVMTNWPSFRGTTFLQNFHFFVHHFFRDIQCRTKANGILPRFQNKQTAIEQLPPDAVARF